jgi:tRNA(adenine34) deaminase
MAFTVFSDEYYMQQALQEAVKAGDLDEVPVGAVIVCNDRIIARGHNQTEKMNDVTAHAEMLAITAASNFLGTKYLGDCTLYVTVEPCLMCAGALFWARPARIVYGCSDEKRGFTNLAGSILHPKTELASGILQKKCSELITGYFRQKR